MCNLGSSNNNPALGSSNIEYSWIVEKRSMSIKSDPWNKIFGLQGQVISILSITSVNISLPLVCNCGLSLPFCVVGHSRA